MESGDKRSNHLLYLERYMLYICKHRYEGTKSCSRTPLSLHSSAYRPVKLGTYFSPALGYVCAHAQGVASNYHCHERSHFTFVSNPMSCICLCFT